MTFKFWASRTDKRVRYTDFNNLALSKKNFLISGCAVTGAGTDMDIDVAEGKVFIGGDVVEVSAGSVTLTAADATNDRFDIIAIDGTGTIVKIDGTAGAPPVTPSYTEEDYVVLAGVIVQNGVTTIATSDVEEIGIEDGGFSKINKGASDPASGVIGELFYNTTSEVFKYYDGSDWINIIDSVTASLTVTSDYYNTIITGLNLVATGAQTIEVTAGTFYDSSGIIVSSAGDVALALSAANATHPRIDLITIADDGTLTVTDGTAAATPSFPAAPANHTIIGTIYRAANDNVSNQYEINEHRVIVGTNEDKVYSYNHEGSDLYFGNTVMGCAWNFGYLNNTYKYFKVVITNKASILTAAGSPNISCRFNNHTSNSITTRSYSGASGTINHSSSSGVQYIPLFLRTNTDLYSYTTVHNLFHNGTYTGIDANNFILVGNVFYALGGRTGSTNTLSYMQFVDGQNLNINYYRYDKVQIDIYGIK